MNFLNIEVIQLDSEEIQTVRDVVRYAMQSNDQADISGFLSRAAVIAQELPIRIRTALYDFKLQGVQHAVCIRDTEFDESLAGPTPDRHRGPGETEYVREFEARHLLFGTMLGEAFGWTSIQNGYILNDVMPVAEHRALLTSSSADVIFDLHTEDAFHRRAGDYLGLMCVRNPTRVPTTLACLKVATLPKHALDILFQPRFIVGANVAHSVQQPQQLSPILWGNSDWPYLRINLNATWAADGDNSAAEALKLLVQNLRSNSQDVVFAAGDCWYIDNYRVAHGRGRFAPEYQGGDRWLKRLYLSSSFRISAASRSAPAARSFDPNSPDTKWI